MNPFLLFFEILSASIFGSAMVLFTLTLLKTPDEIEMQRHIKFASAFERKRYDND